MKFFKKSDILIVLIILAAGAVIWTVYNRHFSEAPAKAEIYYKSELVKTVDLTKGQDKTFSIPQNQHVIFHLEREGTICFEDSDCPDKICVRTGKLSRVGQTAACLPNEIILKIVPSKTGRSDNDIDLVVGR